MRRCRAVGLFLAVAMVAVACTGSGEPSDTDADAAGRPTASVSTPASPASPAEPPLEPSATGTADPAASPSLTAELTLGGAGSFRLDGTYPHVESSCRRFTQPTFEARYPGDVTVERGDGKTLRVVVTVPFDEYLKGIVEVPPTWPVAALEAQAIAARSYALARIGFDGPEGASIETPICATTACQVYGGIPIEPTTAINRWYAAVRRTDGRSLVFQGRPADAVYFSTSNGRTYGNDEVFGSAPLPYLRGTIERDDGASPTSHWRVPLPYDDLRAFLSARGLWGDRRITHVGRRNGVVEIRGGGRAERLDEGSFREAVNGAAPCLLPGRYPTDSSQGTELPLTIPSRWYTTDPGPGAVELVGRGWGHGVGMVQWGAYGKARKGWSAARILAAYYGGLEPRPFPEPGTIRVLVAEGLTSLTVAPEGPGASFGTEPLDGRVVVLEPGKDGVRTRIRRAR